MYKHKKPKNHQSMSRDELRQAAIAAARTEIGQPWMRASNPSVQLINIAGRAYQILESWGVEMEVTK